MDADRTRLAVRTLLVSLRSARISAERIGGERGKDIEQRAKSRAREILDDIDQRGTGADEEKAAARRELEGDRRTAFRIEERAPTEPPR